MFEALFDAAWAQTLVAWLATYALHSTLLLGAAWLASRWITSALPLDALWKTAVLAGVVTTSVQMGLQPSIYAVSSASESTLVVLRGEDVGQLIELSVDQIVVQQRGVEGRGEAAPLVIERAPRPSLVSEPTAASSGWTPIPLRTNWRLPEGASPWVAVLAGFWLLGFAVEGLRRARTHRRFVNGLNDRVPVESVHLLAEVKWLGARAGLRYPLRLTQSDALAVPVALGVDEVVLPTWAVEDTALAEQRALLAHEVGHLARRDSFWLAVFAVVESVFFFQPLNHLARRRQQAAAERLCDAWAAEQASPLAMARCLVDAAGRLRAHRLGGASSALPHLVPCMAAGHGASLGDRVEHLIDGHELESKRRWPVLFAACCAIGLVACVGPAVTSTAQVPPTPPTPAAAPAPPAAPVVLAFPGAPEAPTPPSAQVEVASFAPAPLTVPVPAIAPLAPLPAVVPAGPDRLVAPPAAAMPVIPVAPPAPVAPDTNRMVTYTREEDNRRVRIQRRGRATFDDNGRLVALSEGGRLLVEEEVPSFERRYEARTRDDGSLVEVYEVDGDVQPLDEPGLRWMRERLEEARGTKPPPPPHPPLPSGVGADGERDGARAHQGQAYERDLAVYRARIETYASQQTEALREAYRGAQAQYEQRRQAVQGQAASSEEAARAIEELSRELEGQVRELDLGAYTLDGDIAQLAEQLQRLTDVRDEADYAQVRDQLEAALAQLESYADAHQGTGIGVRLSAEQLQQRATEFEREAERLRKAAEQLRLEAETDEGR